MVAVLSVVDPTNHIQRLSMGCITRSVGADYLSRLKAARQAKPAVDEARKEYIGLTCWHDTPELYRRMVAHAAGYGKDVVAKLDRELTEVEKARLRAAASDMRLAMSSLVRL